MTVTIRNISVTCTRPGGFNLTIVRVNTSEPGLYGLGCGTFTYRHETVAHVIEEYLNPLLIGRDVSRIEDIWQMMNVATYWRNGPVINNAIGAGDLALWDIKGKMAGMPVYDLLGGRSREAVPVYCYAESGDLDELVDQVKAWMARDVDHVRIQLSRDPVQAASHAPQGAQDGYYIDPQEYCRRVVRMFDYVRTRVGDQVELCHDVHERVAPSTALWLAKRVEPYSPLFLEDLLPPDQGMWYRHIRCQTSTPLAHGELFNNPMEWEELVKERLIDYMRAHVSHIGGLTPARKLAALCEQFGVRMAWHGSPDMSPIGYAVNLHLDMAVANFGIQEWPGVPEPMAEMFPGCPYIKGGYAYVSGKPGWGVEFDEKMAAEYPCNKEKTPWIEMRLPDGSMQKP